MGQNCSLLYRESPFAGKSSSLAPQTNTKSPRLKSHSGGQSEAGGQQKKLSSSTSPHPPSSNVSTTVSARVTPLTPAIPLKAPPPPTLPEKARHAYHHKVAAEERTQEKCFGNRSYSEVVVETYKPTIAAKGQEQTGEKTGKCPYEAMVKQGLQTSKKAEQAPNKAKQAYNKAKPATNKA